MHKPIIKHLSTDRLDTRILRAKTDKKKNMDVIIIKNII